MYALALLGSAGVVAATTGLPYFHLSALDIGLPIQWFGMIVAAGVLIGAMPLRRYAEWHGVSDEHIRGLLTWIMISGFLGAHEFDVIAYQWERIGEMTTAQPAGWWFLPAGLWPSNWPLVLRIWDGISSYGGFIGGAIGFALYVWWKRLPVRLFADVTIVGLLVAFTIGRIACTVVSDHIGAAVDPSAWYAFLAEDYPRSLKVPHLVDVAGTSEYIRAWNLGLIEFLYLVPVNIVALGLAFRPSKRMPAGFIAVLTGVLYAPVRFFLDFLRPAGTDPPHYGLTFAQWASLLAFGAAIYAGRRILQNGAPAETVTRTSAEAQERLKIILREDDEAHKQQEVDKKTEVERKQTEAERKKAELAKLRAERDREDAELAAAEAAERAKPQAATAAAEADDEDADDEAGDGAVAAETEVAAATEAKLAAAAGGKATAAKAGNRPAGGKSGKAGAKKKNRKR